MLEVSVEKQLAGTDFGGTILVARAGSVLLRRGYGLADRSFGLPAAPDTTYRIASITKLFAAAIVTRLWTAGRLDLDAPIATYLTAYKGPAGPKVTIRQLLHHTSGIENFDKGLDSFNAATRTGLPAYQIPHVPRELMDRFASGPLVHAPGTTFDYNNADFVILGQIVEAIEQLPFDRVVARDILTPLGMKATGMAEQSRIIVRMARTYYKDGDAPLVNDMPIYPENWYAAGGMYSTVDDLLTFATALYGGRLVSAPGIKAMLAPGLDEYGFGQWVAEFEAGGRKRRFAQRPGRIMGANTLLLRLLDDDVTIVILANTNLVDTDKLGFAIARQVLTADATTPRATSMG